MDLFEVIIGRPTIGRLLEDIYRTEFVEAYSEDEATNMVEISEHEFLACTNKVEDMPFEDDFPF